MKVLNISAGAAIILLIVAFPSSAQDKEMQEMTLVVPAGGIARAIKPLLPYKLDLGKNFLGSLYVKSIENIKIKDDKIFFDSIINGKDIKYATKIGKQIVNFVVGDVRLPSRWEISFDYDKIKKQLLLKPNVQELKDEKDFSQGDALVNALFKAFGGLEYPIAADQLKPLKTEINNNVLTVKWDIADVYTTGDKVFVEVIPIARTDPLIESNRSD